jgi:hypothetical protein
MTSSTPGCRCMRIHKNGRMTDRRKFPPEFKRVGYGHTDAATGPTCSPAVGLYRGSRSVNHCSELSDATRSLSHLCGGPDASVMVLVSISDDGQLEAVEFTRITFCVRSRRLRIIRMMTWIFALWCHAKNGESCNQFNVRRPSYLRILANVLAYSEHMAPHTYIGYVILYVTQ